MSRLWLSLFVLAVPATALAQLGVTGDASQAAERFGAIMQAHTVRIDGAEEPHRISYLARMNALFQFGHGVTVNPALQLTNNDRDRIAGFMEARAQLDEATATEFRLLTEAVCEEIDGKADDEVDGLELMARMSQLQQAHDAEAETRYMSLMRSLSPEAQQSIERYVASQILPQMKTSDTDYLAVAAEFPSWPVQNFRLRCSGSAPPRPVIVSSGRSRTGAGLRSGPGFVGGARDAVTDGSAARAYVAFNRILRAAELQRYLQNAGLQLETLHYREVGPYTGRFTFAAGTDTQTALAAAESNFRYTKLAEVYAAQHSVPWVYVPEIGPMGTARPMKFGNSSAELGAENAARPGREELDALSPQVCVADDRLDQPFRNEGPDAAGIEAACGLRLYAVVARGEPDAIESFAAALETADQVIWYP